MRISDWSSDVCSSDLILAACLERAEEFAEDTHMRPQLEIAMEHMALEPDPRLVLRVLAERGIVRVLVALPDFAAEAEVDLAHFVAERISAHRAGSRDRSDRESRRCRHRSGAC